MNKEYHVPVLLQASVEGLITDRDGVYIDLTFGGGGHAMTILNQLNDNGHLIAFDQDEDAIDNAFTDKRLTLIRSNFKYFWRFLRFMNIEKVDGILVDLGVSSWQFDSDERGFSFRFDQALDMRMNQMAVHTAADVLNKYSESDLVRMFSELGEVRNSKSLAKAVVGERLKRRWESTSQLNALLSKLRMGEEKRYFSQVYQALRMEVNDELGVIKEMLEYVPRFLRKGGRFVVLSYHSVEDRLVKRFLKNGSFDKEPIKDEFGNFQRSFKKVGKNVIEANGDEVKENPRSRSAKLRIVERI